MLGMHSSSKLYIVKARWLEKPTGHTGGRRAISSLKQPGDRLEVTV